MYVMHFPYRTKLCLVIYDKTENAWMKVATFNNEEAADYFLKFFEQFAQNQECQKGCWTPVSEHMPEEDFCTGRGIQHSAELLATVVNHGADDETFVDMMVTADGEWKMVHPIDGDNDITDWCEVVAWMPLPEPYKGVQNG